MTERKDDGGPFHPMAIPSEGSWVTGASFRAVSAMYNHAALLGAGVAVGTKCSACGHIERSAAAQIAVSETDSLIAELKK